MCRSKCSDRDNQTLWNVHTTAAAAKSATKRIIGSCPRLAEIVVQSTFTNVSDVVPLLPLCSLRWPLLKKVDLSFLLYPEHTYPVMKHQHNGEEAPTACNNIEILLLHFASMKETVKGFR
jgi:hypothetical protein